MAERPCRGTNNLSSAEQQQDENTFQTARKHMKKKRQAKQSSVSRPAWRGSRGATRQPSASGATSPTHVAVDVTGIGSNGVVVGALAEPAPATADEDVRTSSPATVLSPTLNSELSSESSSLFSSGSSVSRVCSTQGHSAAAGSPSAGSSAGAASASATASATATATATAAAASTAALAPAAGVTLVSAAPTPTAATGAAAATTPGTAAAAALSTSAPDEPMTMSGLRGDGGRGDVGSVSTRTFEYSDDSNSWLTGPGGTMLVPAGFAAALETLWASPVWQLSQVPSRFEYSDRSSGLAVLGLEISLFVAEKSLTQSECGIREYVAWSVRHVTSSLWPSSTVNVVGSSITGLALPDSDIDLVVLGVSEPAGVARLYALQQGLEQCSFEFFVECTVIASASVPVLKLRTCFDFCVDVSFDITTSQDAALFVRDACVRYRPLRQLALLYKSVLRVLNLNDAYTGGLSSYAITLMALSMLQRYSLAQACAELNVPVPCALDEQVDPHFELGLYALLFLKVYGPSYDENCIISVRGDSPGGLILMPERPTSFGYFIEDPIAPSRDNIARVSFRADVIRNFLTHTFAELSRLLGLSTPAMSLLAVLVDPCEDLVRTLQCPRSGKRLPVPRMPAFAAALVASTPLGVKS